MSSPALPPFLRAQSDGVCLFVRVRPRASHNAIGEPLGGELRIRVSAPPVDAAANQALLRLLAETFDCSRSAIELVRGHTSRHKVVRIRGLSAAEVLARLGMGPAAASADATPPRQP